MSNLDKALADITAIRSQIAQATEFRGYGPSTFAITGALAAVAALAQSRWIATPATDINAYLGLWIATAAVSAGAIGLEMVTRSRRIHSDLADDMIRTAVEQFLPAATAGVLITAVFWRFAPQGLPFLPGLWQILFSVGVFASRRFLPRPLHLVGFWYLSCGVVTLGLAGQGVAFSPWVMGIPFGIGQLLVAALLQLNGGPDERG